VATRRPGQARSSRRARLARWHGVAGGDVRFGAGTFFNDVLVRFGYDLFEYEHPWSGEWIDDSFEAAAKELRATSAKLVRALEAVQDDPETGPLSVDLCVAYVQRLLDELAIVIPNCHGVDGRSLPRGDLAALGYAPPVDLKGLVTQADDLYLVVDAGDRAALPGMHERVRARSQEITRAAIATLDGALAVLCPWLDDVVARLQREIASRAEDGNDLLQRWTDPNWTIVGRSTPNLRRRLPQCS